MCRELLLLVSADNSKDKMIKSVSSAILNNHGDAANEILTLINEEGIDGDTVKFLCAQLLVNICYFIQLCSKSWVQTFDIF